MHSASWVCYMIIIVTLFIPGFYGDQYGLQKCDYDPLMRLSCWHNVNAIFVFFHCPYVSTPSRYNCIAFLSVMGSNDIRNTSKAVLRVQRAAVSIMSKGHIVGWPPSGQSKTFRPPPPLYIWRDRNLLFLFKSTSKLLSPFSMGITPPPPPPFVL